MARLTAAARPGKPVAPPAPIESEGYAPMAQPPMRPKFRPKPPVGKTHAPRKRGY